MPQAANATGGKNTAWARFSKASFMGLNVLVYMMQLRYKKGARGKPLTPFMSAPSGEAALTESRL